MPLFKKKKFVKKKSLKKFNRRVLSFAQLAQRTSFRSLGIKDSQPSRRNNSNSFKKNKSQRGKQKNSQSFKRHRSKKFFVLPIEQVPIKPIIAPKAFVIILKKRKATNYNQRIIDYKHCGLLQRYIGLGGKILSRKQTKLPAKVQRCIAKNIKTARIMGFLPFVNKQKSLFS